MELPGGEASWAEFEAIIDHHKNGGEWYLLKDVGIFADRYGWQDLLRSDDKKVFGRRVRLLCRYYGSREYALHRRQQLDDALLHPRPAHHQLVWIFKAWEHGGCDDHTRFEGIALPPDHPFWSAFLPPNDWHCGCSVRSAWSRSSIVRAGGDPDKQLPPDWNAQASPSGLPVGIAPGFMGRDYPDLRAYFEWSVLNGWPD